MKHNLKFCEEIHHLSSNPHVKNALGLPGGGVESTERFVKTVLQEEEQGKTISRVIIDEYKKIIGITTLMHINRQSKSCHIGSWLGYEYWSKGYNQASKIEILKIAFEDLKLNYVFAGARKENIRSQKAQEKLPFIRLHIESEFPEEHRQLIKRERKPCVLHGFYRDDFFNYLEGYSRNN